MTPISQPAPLSPGLVVLLLSVLLGLQPLTTDLYLPALPALVGELGGTPAAGQRTMTVVLLGFGLAQLVWGPLSDRFGRRPILLAGLAGYCLAAAAGALASSMDSLIAWRFVQGACMGAGTVCARAIARDLYAPPENVRMLSKGLSGLGIAACLGPLAGGLLSEAWGARAALWSLLLAGGAALGLVAWGYRETRVRPATDAPPAPALRQAWRRILGSPVFWRHALLCTASLAGLVAFLSTSSFLIVGQHGVSQRLYGAILLSVSLAYIGGTVFCRLVLRRYRLRRTLQVGALLSLLTAVAGLTLTGRPEPSLLVLIAPAWLYMLAHGFHQPCGQSGALAPFPESAGSASALTGCLMMLVAVSTAQWIGPFIVDRPALLPQTLAAWSLVAVVLAGWCSLDQHADPAHR